MSSSLFEGLIRSQDAQWSDYAPDDTAWVRALASNAAHLADQSAQVVANWRDDTRYVIRDRDAALNELGVYTSTYPIWASAPFHLRFRPDGSSYRIRIRIRARLDSSGSNVLRAALDTGSSLLAPSLDTRSLDFSMSSTTAAWLSSPTGGDGNGNVYAANAAECLTDETTFDELGGDRVAMRTTKARIVIYGSPPGGTPVAIRLHGVHAAEFIGP
ncbi:MAG: hypothetical protein H6721_12340 [Sandaracinus sp.]|nr:hypothetical protein [Sandaracinus sp.]